jgi:hypothetical protein
MRTRLAGQAPLELGSLDVCDVVLTRRATDGTVTSRVRWAARSTSHAVTCDYLMGRRFRECSCRASDDAVR